MIEFFGIKLSFEAAAFLALFLLDELVPYLPIKGNNFVQVLRGIVGQLKTFRKEDDVVSTVKTKLTDVHEEVKKL